MNPPTAKAHRCESCGAGLPADDPTCDYCGSHHDLPAYRAEAPPTPVPAGKRTGVILVASLLLAAAAGFVAWLAS